MCVPNVRPVAKRQVLGVPVPKESGQGSTLFCRKVGFGMCLRVCLRMVCTSTAALHLQLRALCHHVALARPPTQPLAPGAQPRGRCWNPHLLLCSRKPAQAKLSELHSGHPHGKKETSHDGALIPRTQGNPGSKCLHGSLMQQPPHVRCEIPSCCAAIEMPFMKLHQRGDCYCKCGTLAPGAGRLIQKRPPLHLVGGGPKPGMGREVPLDKLGRRLTVSTGLQKDACLVSPCLISKAMKDQGAKGFHTPVPKHMPNALEVVESMWCIEVLHDGAQRTLALRNQGNRPGIPPDNHPLFKNSKQRELGPAAKAVIGQSLC
mmetsp:Transcript_17825/g.34842  ORF Transcript_17825/g.34842 Transcript_17825/m.34842 type:complete len:318 (+) Transcript_17825:191-1144(+)